MAVEASVDSQQNDMSVSLDKCNFYANQIGATFSSYSLSFHSSPKGCFMTNNQGSTVVWYNPSSSGVDCGSVWGNYGQTQCLRDLSYRKPQPQCNIYPHKCTMCDEGYELTSTTCTQCSAGKYVSGVGTCTKCSRGSYQPNNGIARCLGCGTGLDGNWLYQNEEGQTSCKTVGNCRGLLPLYAGTSSCRTHCECPFVEDDFIDINNPVSYATYYGDFYAFETTDHVSDVYELSGLRRCARYCRDVDVPDSPYYRTTFWISVSYSSYWNTDYCYCYSGENIHGGRSELNYHTYKSSGLCLSKNDINPFAGDPVCEV